MSIQLRKHNERVGKEGPEQDQLNAETNHKTQQDRSDERPRLNQLGPLCQKQPFLIGDLHSR
jgi:hypothetical protein